MNLEWTSHETMMNVKWNLKILRKLMEFQLEFHQSADQQLMEFQEAFEILANFLGNIGNFWETSKNFLGKF